ncbi:MAG: hypothetical protein JKY37_00920 [Nannocystaceae bacterium]|nr:hypothetical protein [Nannocystaceae bacterium]
MPAAMIVEWGWLGGGAVFVGLTAWWLLAFFRTRGRRDATARRIVLLGMLAVAIQNAADFSLELLGVAAPMVALAVVGTSGALGRDRRPARRRRIGPVEGAAYLRRASVPRRGNRHWG